VLPGPQNVYLYTKDLGALLANFQKVGTWTTASVSSDAPVAVSVDPDHGQDLSMTFKYRASSANGYGYIMQVAANLDSGVAPAWPHSCYVYYYPKAYNSV